MLRLSHITATGILLFGLSASLYAEEISLPTFDEAIVTEEVVPEDAMPLPEPSETATPAAAPVESVATKAPAPAESVATEAPPQTGEFSIKLPGRGMSMEMVQNRFGDAREKFPAVGTPPITRWIYNNFTVYFESEFVIHAVVNN